MKVFISWSGERSRAVAEFLRYWLPEVIQAVQPWMSAEDIDPGVRWSSEIARELEASKCGVICLTPENLNTQWMLFEAGALAKSIESTYVCPYLIGFDATDLKSPLAHFQAARANKDGTLNLVRSINKGLGMPVPSEDRLRRAFNRCWPELEEVLQNLPPPETMEPVSSHKGLEGVFLNRGAALDALAKHLKLETEKALSGSPARVWIVSSSLKGFIVTAGQHFDGQEILERIAESGCEFSIMMTAPEMADLRAAQEGRNPGAIQTEIQEGISLLKNAGIRREQIRFYPGTPTVFAVATMDRMLLNPYPYERESHRCFSLIVRVTEDNEDIYHQYLEYHFKRPWKRGKEVSPEEWGRRIHAVGREASP